MQPIKSEPRLILTEESGLVKWLVQMACIGFDDMDEEEADLLLFECLFC